MGICWGSPSTKPENPQPPTKIVATSAETEAWSESSWREDAQKIWGRPISRLPVHLDLPRLCKKVLLIVRGTVVIDPESSKGDEVPETIIKILKAMLRALDSDFNESELDELYTTHLRSTKDIPHGLEFLLQAVSETRTAAVLKACHQKVIFPAYYLLKSQLFNSLPFKDLRGSWHLIVEVGDNAIIVRHRKSQEDAQDAESHFEFEWELEISFNMDVTEITSLQVRIREIHLHDDLSPEKREQVTNVLNAFRAD